MRVLITGARGQLGQSLRNRIPDDWEVIFTDSKTLDITNKASVDSMVSGFQPDVIINTAAYTNVDKAEEEPELAFAVNATGVANLAQAAESISAQLIHISTDYVFSGDSTQPYTELDFPNPNTVYGKSKLAGELLALSLCDKTKIIRTSWVFSEYGNNFIPTIARKIFNNEPIIISDNNIGTPTYVGALADFVISHISEKCVVRTIHYSGNQSISRFDLVQLIKEIMLNEHIMDTYIGNIQIQADIQSKVTSRPKYSALTSIHSSLKLKDTLAQQLYTVVSNL